MTRIAGMPQASFSSGSSVMLFVSTGSEVPWPATSIERGNSSSRALYSLPHDGPFQRRPQRPDHRLRADARIEAAAAVEAALRIGVVEVVQDARDLHALVLVELVLEHAAQCATA